MAKALREQFIPWVRGLHRTDEIVHMAAELNVTPASVTGACMCLWDDIASRVEVVGRNAVLRCRNASQRTYIDTLGMLPGLADAMERAGWAAFEDDRIVFVGLGQRMGYDAVRQLCNRERQQRFRDRNRTKQNPTENVTHRNADRVTRNAKRNAQCVTNVTEEKRREDIHTASAVCTRAADAAEPPPLFPESKPPAFRQADIDAIYAAYPRKVGKPKAVAAIGKALGAIRNRGDPDPVGFLLGKVREFAKSDKGNAGDFTPHPATWMNQGRYDDDPAEWRDRDGRRSPARIEAPDGKYDEVMRRARSFGADASGQPRDGGSGADENAPRPVPDSAIPF